MLANVPLHSVCMISCPPFIGWHSLADALEDQSVELGAGSEETKEVAGATEGEAMLQKNESVDEGEKSEPAK